jgi:hypothetical protein
MTPSPRILTILLLLSVSILGSQTVLSPAAAQTTGLEFTIPTLNPTSYEVTVTSTQDGTATFKGWATLKDPDGEPVSITLSASTSTGWNTTITPETYSVTKSTTVNLTIIVTVPKGTGTWQIGKMIVTGSATFSGGTLKAISSVTVVVQQYYGLELTITPTYKGPAMNRFGLQLKNTGNGLDKYHTEVMNGSRLAGNHLTVDYTYIDNSYVVVGEYMDLVLTVEYSGNVRPKEYEVDLKVSSLGSGYKGPTYWRTYTVHVSFNAPDTGVPTWAFTGGIAAFSITMVIVLVAIMKGSKKKPPVG